MHQAILQEIQNEGEPWIVGAHLRPDGDAFGSVLAAYYLLQELGQKAQIYLPEEIPSYFQSLFSEACVTQEVPKEAFRLLLIDAAPESKRIGLDPTLAQSVVNFDHHQSNVNASVLCHNDTHAASASMLMWELAENMALPKLLQNRQFQRACYLGLISDTARYSLSNADERALHLGARILAKGLKVTQMRKYMFPPVALEIQKRAAQSLLNAFTLLDGRLSCAFLKADDLDNEAIQDVKGIILSQMQMTKGVTAVLLARNDPQGQLQVSLRCNTPDGWDMNQAASLYGGGGHKGASGFTTEKDSFEEVCDRISKHLDATYKLS